MHTFDGKQTTVRIAVHAFDRIPMFHLSAPLLVFAEVAALGLGQEWRTTVWTNTGKPVRTAEGIMLGDVRGPEILEAAELLILPSWDSESPGVDPELSELIRRAHRRGTVVVGLCLGAFPVAASGILDGRSAVTHWVAATDFARRYPRVRVDPRALYIDHGDVLTSAGTASGLDACLHLVRERLGSRAATTVARKLVIAPHREGDQAQYIERPLACEPVPGPVSRVMAEVLHNLEQPMTVAEMAASAHMSTRNFSCVFTGITGSTPRKWLNQQRLDHARLLLESTGGTIADIARASGFRSPVTFRQRFHGREGWLKTSRMC